MAIPLPVTGDTASVVYEGRFRWRFPTQLHTDVDLVDVRFHQQLQANIELVLARGVTLKRCKARWISLAETADGPMVVKMFVERSWRHSLKRLFLRPRATLYQERARQIVEAGICTPVPVATVVERCGRLAGNSCVVYRYAAGQILSTFRQSIATDESLMPVQRSRIIDQLRSKLIALGERLAAIGIVHTDVHLGNFIIDKNYSLHLLDLDSLRSTRNRQRLLWSRQQFQKIEL